MRQNKFQTDEFKGLTYSALAQATHKRPMAKRNALIAWEVIQGMSYKDLGEKFDLSPERVRQIETHVHRVRRASRLSATDLKQALIWCACGNSLDPDKGSVLKSGWDVLVSTETIYFVCPGCVTDLKRAAQMIADYGDRNVTLSTLIVGKPEKQRHPIDVLLDNIVPFMTRIVKKMHNLENEVDIHSPNFSTVEAYRRETVSLDSKLRRMAQALQEELINKSR